jgi:ankyrin repeat protein
VKQEHTYECARILLDHGADALQQDINGRSPLHNFYNDVIKEIILRHGEEIDPYMQDRRGMTILHWAAWSRRSSPHILPDSHQTSKGRSWLEIKDTQGKSILHYAVQRGNLDLIAFFFASPYATTMSMPDYTGRTLLHYATESGQVDTINFLLDMNFNLNATDTQGRTVLHHAATRDNLPAAQRLIQLGAADQLACEDCDGRTPLELAQDYAAKSVVAYFQSLIQENNCYRKEKLDNTDIKGDPCQGHRAQVLLIVALLIVIALSGMLYIRGSY